MHEALVNCLKMLYLICFLTKSADTLFQFPDVANLEKTSNGGNDVEQSMQAFQYFPSVEVLRDLLLDAGFDGDKVDIEVIGAACVIIRCEK